MIKFINSSLNLLVYIIKMLSDTSLKRIPSLKITKPRSPSSVMGAL